MPLTPTIFHVFFATHFLWGLRFLFHSNAILISLKWCGSRMGMHSKRSGLSQLNKLKSYPGMKLPFYWFLFAFTLYQSLVKSCANRVPPLMTNKERYTLGVTGSSTVLLCIMFLGSCYLAAKSYGNLHCGPFCSFNMYVYHIIVD